MATSAKQVMHTAINFTTLFISLICAKGTQQKMLVAVTVVTTAAIQRYSGVVLPFFPFPSAS